MEIVTCPECGAPAEAESRGELGSSAGRVELVKMLCARRHWFLLPREALACAEPPPVRDPGELASEG
jgi:hypothetical protein